MGLGEADGEWFRPVGCDRCSGTGYQGRTGVFELLETTDAIREGILSGRTTRELEALTGTSGGLRDDALAKAAAGITSLDEVARVLGGP